MHVRFTKLADGPGPSEMLVGIRDVNGRTEEVVVSKRLAQDRGIEVGAPLMSEDDRHLIELPRESTSGKWRIWISQSEVASLQAAE